MSDTVLKITNMLEILPEEEQNLAYAFVKRMVLAWDSDFTKCTSEERKLIEEAEIEFATDNVVRHDEINWD